MNIESFKIVGLHNSLNFEIVFKENTLILLGENGSCKTTIIKMLFYTLSLQWKKLSQYNFKYIEIIIDSENLKITKEETLSFNSNILKKLPPAIRKHINNYLYHGDNISMQKIEEACDRYNFPIGIIRDELYLYDDLNENTKGKQQTRKNLEKLRKKLNNVHILYLPTYRRIEQELRVILEDRIDDEFIGRRYNRYNNDENIYTELIEFGMQDVDDAIQRILTSLKDSSQATLNQLTLRYLDDIVNEKYKEINLDEIKTVDETTIHDIMNRVDQSILSDDSKLKLSKSLQVIKENGIRSDHDRVVCHYFLKLLDSHNELIKKETNIREFIEVCNKYLENKKMLYDSPNFTFSISLVENDQSIKLNQLSSGEKQIVSLFSHLYLSNKKEYIVLIDEPELSLSVKWQKTFLEDIHKGTFCKGLCAVTHSPFIFDNSLDEYAHGLEEYKN